ncbi:hypothetical protein BU17DRAFT_72280 [Hysterangium stoloniferum]|nr:hypothetical protein BU17DRAFT_72280 [Hysterangium stoloniferum]
MPIRTGSIAGPKPVLGEWCCCAYFTGHIPVLENDDRKEDDDAGLDAPSQVTATQRRDIVWSLYVSWRLQWQSDDCPDALPGVKLKSARMSPTVNTAEVNGIDVDVVGYVEALHLVMKYINELLLLSMLGSDLSTEQHYRPLMSRDILNTPGGKDGSLYLSDGTWFNIRIESSSSLGELSTGRRDAERVESESKASNAHCVREEGYTNLRTPEIILDSASKYLSNANDDSDSVVAIHGLDKHREDS